VNGLNHWLSIYLIVLFFPVEKAVAQMVGGRAVSILKVRAGAGKGFNVSRNNKAGAPLLDPRVSLYKRRLVNRLPLNYRQSAYSKIIYSGQKVRIIKLMPDTSIKYDRGEKIVLQNVGPVGLNLSGWTLGDLTAPGNSTNKPLALGAFTFTNRLLEINIDSSQVRLNNVGGDTVTLYDNRGVIQDIFSYDESQVRVDTWIVRKNAGFK